MTLHSNTIWIKKKEGLGTDVYWQFENRHRPLRPQYFRSQNISPPPRPRYCRSQNIRQPSPVDSTWELASDLGSSSPIPSLPLCSDCEPTRATRYIICGVTPSATGESRYAGHSLLGAGGSCWAQGVRLAVICLAQGGGRVVSSY
jgi:hypothetical protein